MGICGGGGIPTGDPWVPGMGAQLKAGERTEGLIHSK